MTSVIDQVKTLIAKTASSSQEEARTCAFIACKLIRENKLVVVDGDAHGNGYTEPKSKPKSKRPGETEYDWKRQADAPPAGTYRARVINVTLSDDEGRPEATVDLNLIKINRTIPDHFIFHKTTIYRITQFSKAAGIDPPIRLTEASIQHWTDAIVGLEVDIVLGYRQFGGRIYANVSRYYPCDEAKYR